MEQGYISIHRKLREHWIFTEKRTFSKLEAWIDILYEVNYKDNKILFDGQLIEVKRGSKITSLRKLSDKWGWSKSKVDNFLEILQNDKMLVVKKDTKKTVLSVVNYDLYQTDEWKKGQQKDTEETDEGHRKDTEETQKATNNKVNNVNNVNKVNNEIKKEKKPLIYSDLGNEIKVVKLTPEQFARCKEKHGVKIAMELIDKIETYCQMNGKTYKDYEAAMRKFAINHISATEKDKYSDVAIY